MKKEIVDFLNNKGFTQLKDQDIYAKYLGDGRFIVAIGEGDGALLQGRLGINTAVRALYKVELKDIEETYQKLVDADFNQEQ